MKVSFCFENVFIFFFPFKAVLINPHYCFLVSSLKVYILSRRLRVTQQPCLVLSDEVHKGISFVQVIVKTLFVKDMAEKKNNVQ